MWVSGQRHTPELYNYETEPVTIVQGAGRTPGSVLTRAENLVPNWDCTCNHKYLLCDAPSICIRPYTPSSR
jgi:hypothetical protein